MIQQPRNIEQLLGPAESRYFGEGFKGFDLRIKSMAIGTDCLQGDLECRYHGPVRPHGAAPHVGSIELLAFTLRIAGHALNRLGHIGIADTDRAFMTHYSLQMPCTLYPGIIPFRCRLLHSEHSLHSLQGSRSTFELQVGNNPVKITLDHRGGGRYFILPEDEMLSLWHEQLHSIGYRHTRLDIADIVQNLEIPEIAGKVHFRSLIEENTLHGIGSARDALLPTDATRVFGQLTQTLLYGMSGTDRLTCPNIWLRKMEISTERPLFENTCPARVVFNRLRDVPLKNEIWKLINLSGTVGNFNGKFEVAYLGGKIKK